MKIKQSLLPAPTSLLRSFKSFSWLIALSFFICNSTTYSKESLTFGDEDQIQVLSDKAYRKGVENTYEAHGNVIIKLKNDSIYGEKASLSFATGEGRVVGNVRYVGTRFTLYATEITYNLKGNKFSAKNAKLVDDNFVILGKEINRFADGHFEATEAEYSTCRDCPESWSMEGLEVKVIPGQYIYLKHAFLKIKGVIVVYIPYIVLPIKKDRETGLLFPKFGFDLDEGFYFQQRFFWAISGSKDLTIAPTFYGQRAYGGELEYRQAINNDSHFKMFTMQSFDRIWAPNKLDDDLRSDRKNRQYFELENFNKFSNRFSFYVQGKYLSDFDIQSDYDIYLKDRLLDNESGTKFGFQKSFPNFYIGLEGNFKNNSFYENSKGFDHSYVQTLPRVELAHGPINLFQFDSKYSPISRISFWQTLNFDFFKQNHQMEDDYIRNMQRYDYTPTLKVYIKPLGPFHLTSSFELDYQHYQMPFEKEGKSARKIGHSIDTSLWIEFEKNFGEAYIRKIKTKPEIMKTTKSNLISEIPSFEDTTIEKIETYSSYKHLLKFSLNHQVYNQQDFTGNKKLKEQFEVDSSDSRFDYRDLIRGRNQNLFDVSTRTDLPESNTIEFNIVNSLLKKTPKSNLDPFKNFVYQLDNFTYGKVAYFNVSQGLLLGGDDTQKLEDKLTRLATTFGVSFDKFSISGSEYYFHKSGEHITSLNLSSAGSLLNAKIAYVYDSYSSERRFTQFDFILYLSDKFVLKTGQSYSFESKRVYESYIGGLYTPLNNCWMFDLEYRQKDTIRNGDLVKDRLITINFFLNYNSKSYTSFLGLQL